MTESSFMHNMVHPEDQHLSINEITASPIGAQLFDFSETELFPPETLQNSEVDSTSNCCYEEQSSYPKHQHLLAGDPSTPTVAGNSNLSIIFDDDQIDNDISASIDFTASPLRFSGSTAAQYLSGNQEPFTIPTLNNQFSMENIMGGCNGGSHNQFAEEPWPAMAAPSPPVIPLLPPPYEEEYLPYLRMRTTQPGCSLVDPIMTPYFPAATTMSAPPFSGETTGIFPGGGFILGTDLSHQELEFQGDNGNLFLPETVPRIFNCTNDLQALSNESPHFVHGGVTTGSNPLASEITSMEDPNFKVEKLSAEERKRKIHIYMKKRNERNFSKKIKYACRKTLADSRPRVRGRFAKNDELVELARTTSSTHEDDTDEDISLFSNSVIPKQPKQRKVVGMKEEEDLGSATDIFAQINGVNSYKCNYPIQFWI